MDRAAEKDVEALRVGVHTRSIRRSTCRLLSWPLLIVAILTLIILGPQVRNTNGASRIAIKIPRDAASIKARCGNLDLSPGPSASFKFRSSSDRFVPGTRATLIRNATIWTGNTDGSGVIMGDILLDKGLIKIVGGDSNPHQTYLDNFSIDIVEANGGWVTPGYAHQVLHQNYSILTLSFPQYRRHTFPFRRLLCSDSLRSHRR